MYSGSSKLPREDLEIARIHLAACSDMRVVNLALDTQWVALGRRAVSRSSYACGHASATRLPSFLTHLPYHSPRAVTMAVRLLGCAQRERGLDQRWITESPPAPSIVPLPINSAAEEMKSFLESKYSLLQKAPGLAFLRQM